MYTETGPRLFRSRLFRGPFFTEKGAGTALSAAIRHLISVIRYSASFNHAYAGALCGCIPRRLTRFTSSTKLMHSTPHR